MEGIQKSRRLRHLRINLTAFGPPAASSPVRLLLDPSTRLTPRCRTIERYVVASFAESLGHLLTGRTRGMSTRILHIQSKIRSTSSSLISSLVAIRNV
jgi:hypothetical protein